MFPSPFAEFPLWNSSNYGYNWISIFDFSRLLICQAHFDCIHWAVQVHCYLHRNWWYIIFLLVWQTIYQKGAGHRFIINWKFSSDEPKYWEFVSGYIHINFERIAWSEAIRYYRIRLIRLPMSISVLKWKIILTKKYNFVKKSKILLWKK